MKLFKISIPRLAISEKHRGWLLARWMMGRQFRDIVSKIVTSLLRMKNWNSMWNFEVYIRRWMYTQYLSHIQGVSFISLKAMKACIRHSNDRHCAQENIKVICCMNSILGWKSLFFTWCELEWHKKPTWHVSRSPYSNFLTVEQIGFGGHHLACGCPLEPAGRISRNLVSALYQWDALQSCVYLSALLNLQ